MVTTILSWVLTYALHSTVLILSIWLICRYVPKLSLSTQEVLWKVALGGAVLTTTVQLGAGVQPPWGHVEMPRALASDDAAPVVATPAPVAPSAVHHRAGELTIVATRTPVAAGAAAVAAAPASEPGGGALPWVVLSLVLAGSVVGLVRLGFAAHKLRGQLAGRRDVIEDPLLETWLSLCSKANLGKRVRLSAVASISSPVALMGREICVPERAIEGLTPAQQQGMLAHELAHVLRRDPEWLVASAIVEAIFFFQPLHHLVRRKIEEVSEFQCDDWAAQHSGTGVHLAKCLAEVAAWVDRQPASPMAATMASQRSPIIRRITRLLDEARVRPSELPRPWRVGGALALLGGVAWLAPAVSAKAEPKLVATAAAKMPEIVVEDVPAGSHDRARVRIVGTDAAIDLDVAAPRAIQPPPPPPPVQVPPPPPAPRSSEMRIIIQGGWSMDGWLFGPHSGYLGIEVDGLDLMFADPFFGDVDPLELGDAIDVWGDAADAWGEAAEAQAEAHAEALEAAAEAREQALEDAARAWEDAARARAQAPVQAPAQTWGARTQAYEGAPPPAPAPSGLIDL
jgi:beta-lactamase regulating signal transducer with metallopeptidase domain